MACRLFGAKPLPEPMLPYCQLYTLTNKLHWKLYQGTKLFMQENALENACEIAAILSRGRRVNIVTGYGAWQHQAITWFNARQLSTGPLVNIGSGCGLLPDGTKSISKLGLRQSESRIDQWIIWELTPISRLRFSKIYLFTDCSPPHTKIQTAPVTAQCACSHRTSEQKMHCGPVCYNSMIKIDVYCIKIRWFYDKMARIMWHCGGKLVWCQQVSQWGLLWTHFCEVFLKVRIVSPTRLSTRFQRRLIDLKNLAESEP